MTAPNRPDPRVLRGERYAMPDDSPARIADYVKGLLKDTEADATARYKIAARNLLFTDGRQNIDWNLQQREWQDAPVQPGQVLTVTNYIRPILRSRLSRILSGEFVWRCVPRSNADEDRDNASVAENLLTARWDSLQMDNRLRYAMWMAFGSGVSFLKSFWNPNLGSLQAAQMVMPHPATGEPTIYPVDGQGQQILDEQGNPGPEAQAFRYRLGDTDTAVRSLFNIRVNPDCYGFDQGEGFRWLIDSEVVPKAVVQERYGIELQSTTSADTHQQNLWERVVRSVAGAFGTQGDRLASAAIQPYGADAVLLSEYWEPQSEVMPNGRLIVMAGEQIVYPPPGEEGPLPQGIVPYVPVYDERRPFDAYGRGTTNDLVSPQRTLNRMNSLILQELRAEGTGQWVGFDVDGVMDQLSDEINTHVKIPFTTQTAAVGIDSLLKQMPHRQINPAWLAMRQEAKAEMFDIGAFHEIQRGQVPPGVDSGVAVQYLMEAENAQLHDTVRTTKQSLISWGRHQLTLARWGYGQSEQRWLRVHRNDMGFLLEDMTGADLPDPELVDLDLEGFAPFSRAAQRADILALMDKQHIPPQLGLQLLDLGRGIEGAYESQTRQYAKARAENLAFERNEVQAIQPDADSLPIFMNQDGSPLLLSKDDDHAMHIERHLEIALDTSKPWPLRMNILAHIQAHRDALDMVAMEQAMKSAALNPQPTPGTAQEAPNG